MADSSSARGYGTGGVAGIYEVANSTRSDCILQEPQPTGSWPVGLATNTLASSTNPPDDASSKLSGGGIAGIVIGVLAFLVLLGLILFFLLRRKRKRRDLADKERRVDGGYEVDLGSRHEEQRGGDEGTIDPFRGDSYDLAPVDGEPEGTPDESTHSSSAGLAGLGAAVGESSRQAGPLPPKRTSPEVETLRITNPADSSEVPVIPAGASLDQTPPVRDRVRTSHDRDRQPTFRRHADAGRWRVPEQEEVVDLPPLYTDIRRDESDAGQ
jgi:hypothetical protein